MDRRDYEAERLMDYEAQVELAAEHLDTHMPGWASRIDIETLDLTSLCNCVIGQLFNDDTDTGETPYRRGFRELDLEWDDDPIPGVHDGVFADNRNYRDLWIAAIRRRVEQAATVQGEASS